MQSNFSSIEHHTKKRAPPTCVLCSKLLHSLSPDAVPVGFTCGHEVCTECAIRISEELMSETFPCPVCACEVKVIVHWVIFDR
ncbi:hypothetical protein FGO68_gene5948 [Halteria grandinella]|uniref:RING-type domain-containing protein n=1 Tax=Halteria grandinella TaxID=5974 RepID=A0A8J8NY72_HALGN|nr:hypothetical protein FGO68_gene5948 [Halteria grandinella]